MPDDKYPLVSQCWIHESGAQDEDFGGGFNRRHSGYLQLQKELTRNLSNYNESSSETYQDSSFSEVNLSPKCSKLLLLAS